MATLTVWKFPSPFGADEAEYTVTQLQEQGLVTVHDAAVVSWPDDASKPHTRTLTNPTASGALGGTFWGFLFGVVFFVPVLGLAAGAAIGGLAGSMSGAGIDKDFIEAVRAKVTQGSSALFLLTSDAVLDKVRDAFAGRQAELIQTNLSPEDELALREAFAD